MSNKVFDPSKAFAQLRPYFQPQVQMKNENILPLFAVMLALEVVLSRFLAIQMPMHKFSLSFIPIVFMAVRFGPMSGGIFAVACDLIGASLFPSGPFHLGFTCCAFLRGFIFGLFLHRPDKSAKKMVLAVILAVLSEQILCSLLLTSLWLVFLFNKATSFSDMWVPYGAMMLSRVPQVLINSTIQIVVISACLGLGQTLFKKKGA